MLWLKFVIHGDTGLSIDAGRLRCSTVEKYWKGADTMNDMVLCDAHMYYKWSYICS